MIENNVDLINEEKKLDYLEDLQRLQAEFENFTKRSEIEKQDILKYSAEKIVIKLLKVLDSFELALKHNPDEGVNLMYTELYSILNSEGLTKISTEGEFDANLHEVLLQENGDVDNKIIEELQTGYMFKEKVIRPAKVKISKVQNE